MNAVLIGSAVWSQLPLFVVPIILSGFMIWALHELVHADQRAPSSKSDLAILAILVPLAGPIASVVILRTHARKSNSAQKERRRQAPRA